VSSADDKGHDVTDPAPYFADLALGPEDGESCWLTTSDGIRIRMGVWNREAERGTVLIFPGRSEYVEKYGPAANDLAQRGFASVAIDWRGQGLGDRLNPNPALGHVAQFSDYQLDVAAVMTQVRAMGLPEPYFLLGHSMGGCIGLRSLFEGLAVEAAAFTAPMWGIQISPALRPVAWTLSSVSRPLRFSHVFAPGQVPAPYVMRVTFEENHLTRDEEMFEWMRSHLLTNHELGLGGPSLHWLNEALFETRRLNRMPSPDLPCLTYLGSREAIVEANRIHERMERWPGGRLEFVEGCEHEIMMEGPAIRKRFFDDLASHFVPRAPRSVAV
jgi:lysophospholipase